MSQPTNPNQEPWLEPLPSQPDPAAYFHAEHPPLEPPSEPFLYPSGPHPPPPPLGLSSAPVYFSSLYATKPHKNRRGIGWAIGALCGIMLTGLVGIGIIHTGFLLATSSRVSAPQPTSTFPAPSGTPPATSITTPLPKGQPTPTIQPTATALLPGTATPGVPPTGTVLPTPTPLPPLTVTIGCLFTQDHKEADFCVDTVANGALAITVLDCDGITDPQAPTTGTTDGTGHYSATWTPRKLKDCSTATITVTATKGTQQGTGQAVLNFG